MSNHTNDVRPVAQPISDACSLNFSVAKVLSIFMVLLGHWFSGTILWVPVTFGLFVFAFSSAFFTAKLYGVELDRKRFWIRKLERLGVRYWLILIFLCAVLAAGNRPLLHWHSLVHFLGLSGVLNWVRIPNQSSLGAGLWFFTLLLIFYAGYPYLARLGRTRLGAMLTGACATVMAVYLEETFKATHELWLTALGFILGVLYGLHDRRLPSTLAGAAIIATCLLLMLFNLVEPPVKQFNTVIIMLISVTICVWLASRPELKNSLFRYIAKLEKYLLEIFLIHTYLFVWPTGNTIIDLLITVSLVLLASMTLHKVEVRLTGYLFGRGSRLTLT